jgi:RHS repeat-associated protein
MSFRIRAWYQAQNAWTTAPQYASKVQEYNYTPDMLNRSSVINNGIVEGYAANGLNQYTGVGGLNPSYNDGNFNLTGFNGATYVYGYTSQLISASKGGNSVQFTYDGLGRCVRRVVNGAARIFTYDGWKPILEWDGAGNWLALNIYGAGPDEILGRYDSIGRVLIYKHDKQGNVVALLDSAGNVVEKYSYDAFGQPTVTDYWGYVRAGSIHENRFMFTGREWIKELGIYDYRNRFYHPGFGRFLQTDPLGFDAGDMNLFRYCGDDPVDRSDPTGLFDMWSNLTKFFNGNPSMNVVRDAWNERRDQGRIVLDLIPAGDRHISTGDFKLDDGNQGLGLTEGDFRVRDPVKQEDGSVKVTGVYTLNVKYPDGPGSTAGPKARMFGYNTEWEHAKPYDQWFAHALVTVREMNARFHFHSPAEARQSLDKQLRPGFEQAYRDSRDLHSYGRHWYQGKYEE